MFLQVITHGDFSSRINPSMSVIVSRDPQSASPIFMCKEYSCVRPFSGILCSLFLPGSTSLPSFVDGCVCEVSGRCKFRIVRLRIIPFNTNRIRGDYFIQIFERSTTDIDLEVKAVPISVMLVFPGVIWRGIYFVFPVALMGGIRPKTQTHISFYSICSLYFTGVCGSDVKHVNCLQRNELTSSIYVTVWSFVPFFFVDLSLPWCTQACI